MKLNCQKTSSKSGIYKISNTHTNRIYIGETCHFKKRWSAHHRALLTEKHKNKFLLNDFKKTRMELNHVNFIFFEVIETMEGSTEKERLAREEWWIQDFISKGMEKILYNSDKNPSTQKYYNLSQSNQNMSLIKKQFYQTEEGIALIHQLSLAKLGKTYEMLYGEEKANEIKQSIRENKLIVMNSPEKKERLRELLTGVSFEERFGEEKAKDIREKMSNQRKGRYTGKESSGYKVLENIQLLSPTGKLYNKIEGIGEFAKKHYLSCNHLSELLSGKRKSHKGWKLITVS